MWADRGHSPWCHSVGVLRPGSLGSWKKDEAVRSSIGVSVDQSVLQRRENRQVSACLEVGDWNGQGIIFYSIRVLGFCLRSWKGVPTIQSGSGAPARAANITG